MKYMKEPKHLGTAGGLAYFHDEINDGLSDAPEVFAFLYIYICICILDKP